MKKIIFCSVFLFAFITACIAQRKVLIEQFTNSGCPPCAGNTPVVADYVNDHADQVLMLSYHTSFPYLDSMYYENAVQSDARVDYYNVVGVPYSVVDGNYFSGNLLPTLETTIDTRAAVTPRYEINFISASLAGNNVMVQIAFKSTHAMNENETLKARVVVAEKNVLKNSYAASPGNNSETEYPWVVRQMLPDENGTDLVNTIFDGMDTLSVTWAADNFKDPDEMRVVAFVQNATTKEIYQAEISVLSDATGVIEVTTNANSVFSLFPTVTNDDFTIQLNNQDAALHLRIFDGVGKEVYATLLDKNSAVQTIHTGILEGGLYFVQVGNENATETKKVFISK